jgi:hypothetical protein
MYPNIHEDTLRRGREELLRRAKYERLVGQEMLKQGMNQKFRRQAVNWLGMHLVSWGEKLKQFGTFAERQPTPTRVSVRQLSKMSPHH